MKRVTVLKHGDAHLKPKGKVLLLPSSLTILKDSISEKFALDTTHLELFNVHGGLIDDIDLIRDDDVIYISEARNLSDLQMQALEDESRDGKEIDSLSGSLIQNTAETRIPVTLPGAMCDSGTAMPLHIQTGSPGNHGGQSHCQTESGSHSALSHVHTESPKSEWVMLNVGGKVFTTTRSTLTRFDTDSMLARMFSEDSDWSSSVDDYGAYLIDRSPLYFEPIINYLRHGKLILDKSVNPEGVLEEAKFFGLTSVIESLEDMIDRDQPADDHTAITRRDLILRLLSTPTNKELRCQGMNFSGANLSKLDLRYINFKYAILNNANLTGANLSYCNFERADLCKATLDSASLLGVKMLCANLEASSMRGCYFEDPAGCKANMEGALMKNVDLEGSHMAGVNLRVATLKNANLQNCDLRGAVLAGADLENCDLTGCDLQEANLRGANLKGATFELMLHPLHMAQTVR